MLQDSFSCNCCTLSSEEVKMGRSVKKGGINLNNFLYKEKLDEIGKRHVNLINRREHLSEKVSTMEKTMPLIVAHNMWKSSDKKSENVVKKIREIVDELSGPSRLKSANKIIEEIKTYIDSLNLETTKLHDRIIEKDVELEEAEIVLESLSLNNAELNNRLKLIQNYSTQGLESTQFQLLDKDDLNCLSKLRELVQQDIHLKNCVKLLEIREAHIRIQLDKILSMKDTTPGPSENDSPTKKYKHDNTKLEYCECCDCEESFEKLF